ncbi:hypothetical protein KPATCC21470_0779 [Kitasatospora purpeofusca]
MLPAGRSVSGEETVHLRGRRPVAGRAESQPRRFLRGRLGGQ